MDAEAERTPPEHLRIKKLQEAHLPDLMRIEQSAATTYRVDYGVPDGVRPTWTERDFARLTRSHDVLVVEADHAVAGYLAWADQAPGIAYIERIAVTEPFRRFGVATVLLRAVGEKALAHGVQHAAILPFNRNVPALSFLAARGFQPIDLGPPNTVASWCQNHLAEHPIQAEVPRSCWWAPTEGLGLIPGLPTP